MPKNLVVFIILLGVLMFIVGCAAVEPEPAEQTKVPASEVKPVEVKPTIEPVIVEPNEIEPVRSEPNLVEPNFVEPNFVEPAKSKPLPRVSFHDKCADILRNFVDENGMVDYKTLRRNRLELKNLLDEFRRLETSVYNSWPEADKIAFWINAYNTQLLRIIVENYPIEPSRWRLLLWPPTSIRHIEGDIEGIWSNNKFIVMEEEFTLSAVESRFFRQVFDEPRVFFALSRASISGPPLRNEPYYGEKLNEQLDDQTSKFLSGTYGFRIDRENKKVYLSSLLQPNGFGNEFISKYGTDKKFKDQQPAVRAVLNFVTNYIPAKDVSFLEVENYSVKYIKYDWRLNEQ